MKLVFNLPHMLRLKAMMQPWEATVTGSDQTRMAKCADEWGYEMIAVPEHFAIPNDHVELSGPHYLQSTVAQAYLAGATERIRLNSCITVLPLQHPIVLAKALATADWMSSGRMMVTFGVGWLAREFELLGVPFSERGRIAERVDFIKSQPEFDGRPFDVVHGLGTTRVGEGHVARDDPNGRPGMSGEEIVERLSWLGEQGVTVSAVPLPPVRSVDEYLDYAQWVIEEVKPKVP
ncbi:LLM class flavin-dependent oxidoreductase [Mycolicibacterium sp. 120270]|uniref:LLM class flavin-dependent oxidoreductase n=1 Tax=Mycolicibacterium sp. 120270 TaxID=3090600 RepID=UPI00299DEAA4|nr:LLM class flavin-dependent oxidoreductase [Mycolicibacterium sp. 120270]MDX1884283.1 LLM class flavin-dependent oxidoreductase [Mycolicibacterium sp. 120270]